MNIVADQDSILQLPDTAQTFAGMSYANTLSIGQAWERQLAQHLTSLGLETRQANQRFIPAYRLQDARAAIARGKKPDHYLRPDPSLYRPYQIDLIAKLGSVRRLVIEVKALNPGAFKARTIHIMAEAKLDRKKLPVHAVILVNQATGQAWVCPRRALWGSDYSLFGKTCRDYTVSRSDLIPLAQWVSQVKAGQECPDLRRWTS